MLFESLPIVVFVGKNNGEEILVVRRDIYTGLPGGVVGENEGLHDCGLRILNSISMHSPLEHKSVFLQRKEDVWDGKMSSLCIVTFPGVKLLPTNGAFWVNPNDSSYVFDITIELFRPVISANPPIVMTA